MAFLSDFSEVISENEHLAAHTSLGVGGPARWFARPRSSGQLADLARRCGDAGVEFRVLGCGANLLVSDDGVDGVVVRLSASDFRTVDWGRAEGWECTGKRRRGDAGGEVEVAAGAGVDMSRLVREAVRHGLSGLECLAGIPGTLGGIIRMNAGGTFGQIADVVREVRVMDLAGRSRTLSAEEVGFRYRDTNLGEAIICGATLSLTPSDPKTIRERFLEIMSLKKESQPLADHTAGCVFKNPPGTSAGALIDQAGLKERRVGGAFVSPCHANFIVADEGAMARDVMTLIGLIRREVAERFGVELELEVQVWGHRWARSVEPVA